MKGIELVTSGLWTTIQDSGRFGYANLGVPVSGAMDQFSFEWVNLLLGNPSNTPAIEWFKIPPILRFHSDALVALTGAKGDVFLNDKRYVYNKAFLVKKGDVLSIKNIRVGNYGYVGIRGGFNSQSVLESFSFYKGITSKFKLIKGDFLSFDKYHKALHQNSKVNIKPPWNSKIVKVFKGPEYRLLNESQKNMLLQKKWTLSMQQDRMAFLLMEKLHNQLPQIKSSPVIPGTVQLTPDGLLIILMRDCQTTGGYPRILQLSENGIHHIAQITTHEEIEFKLTHL